MELITDPTDNHDMTLPALTAEAVLNADAKEPTEQMLRADPVDPILSTEPREAIESTDPSDRSDHNDASILPPVNRLPVRTNASPWHTQTGAVALRCRAVGARG